MIFRKPEPLSPEAERLLAHERAFPPESHALRLRVLARTTSAGSRATLGGPASWSQWRFIRIAGLSVALASASFAAWQELQTPTPIDAAHVGTTLAERTQTIARRLGPEHRPASDIPRSLVTAEWPRPAHSQPALTPQQSQQESQELGLLQRARVALTRGEYANALGVLAEHQRRFPSTSLDEEREALRIKALAGIGQAEEARRAGEKFRERYPRSVLSPQLGDAERAQ
jgi:hypothetical protein